jgi:CO dehydrogenase maturation factor
VAITANKRVMKIGFIGKGGSGKTTVCALSARRVAQLGKPIVAIDADINQHLGSALGVSDEELKSAPKLDDDQTFIKNFLRGSNPRIRPTSMFKTTPPGAGSNLLGIADRNPIERRFAHQVSGVTLMSCGTHREHDIGVHCYHGKTSVVDMILNHTVDGKDEFMMVDMTAGADAFSSTLFTRFDLLVLVVEPTLKSVGVLKQYEELGAGYDLPIAVVGNKVTSADDLSFIRQHAAKYLLGFIGASNFIKNIDRGIVAPIEELEPENLLVVDAILKLASRQEKNWDKYLNQLLEIHRRIGPAWGGGAPKDLLEQIDPSFRYPAQPEWREEQFVS